MSINKDIISNCWIFSHKVTETTFHYYFKRNPKLTKQKAIFDHYRGKLSEWYVYYHLKEKGYACTLPSMSVEKCSNKSFDADLIANNQFHIHVKCCAFKHRSVLFETYELEQIKLLPCQYVVVVHFESNDNMRIAFFEKLENCKFGAPKTNLITKTALYF